MELKLINNSNFSLGNAGATINSVITSNCTKACIKSCPNVSQIDVLRQCSNLANVYMDNIGSVSGPISELIRYASMHGYTNEEPDNTAKPYISGTFNVTGYYTTSQQNNIMGKISNLTIDYSNGLNIDTLFDNDLIAIQTIDSSKTDSYNPAAAIILQSNISDKGTVFTEPIVSGEGRYILLKNEAASITSLGTYFQNKTSIADVNSIVSNDSSQSYDFDNFNQFKTFIGLTTLNTQFSGCSNLESIKLPQLTSCYFDTFQGCSNLEDLEIKATTINGSSVVEVSSNFYGTHTGTLKMIGNVYAARGFNGYKDYVIDGSLNLTGNQNRFINGTPIRYCNIIRIKEEFYMGANSGTPAMFFVYSSTGGSTISFVEMKDLVFKKLASAYRKLFYKDGAATISSNCFLHFTKDSIISSTPTETCISYTRIKKMYVGDGSSKAHDDGIRDLYTNDTTYGWVDYASKIETWWDYNGEYRTYRVDDSGIASGLNNSNPIGWPYITRGQSYQTTLVPIDGFNLSDFTVKVEMYEAVNTTDTTPPAPTDITSSVYNSNTGEINIPNVIGNIIITASAS